MRGVLWGLGAWLPMLGLAEVRWTITPQECRPGDVLELRASWVSPDYAELALEMPAQEALYLVARESWPVALEEGLYRQEVRWILQPLQAGPVELAGWQARVTRAGETRSQELPPLRVVVASYGAVAEDDFTPEPFPASSASPEGGRATGLFGWLVLGGVLVAGGLWWRKRRRGDEAVEGVSPWQALREALERGERPVPLMERLLAEEADELSTEVEQALVGALYGPAGALSPLRAALEKEALE
ncbi:MAG: hypothetical protein AAF555_11655 [Verrucomicrobiota bacterium]